MSNPKNPIDANTLILFGNRLAALRKELGWSQEKLALDSGVARSYLSGVERGRRNISLLNIVRLATTLDYPAKELLNFNSTSVINKLQ